MSDLLSHERQVQVMEIIINGDEMIQDSQFDGLQIIGDQPIKGLVRQDIIFRVRLNG